MAVRATLEGMIRIRPGRAWRLDPRLLSELRGETGQRALARTGLIDALGIEIDGVDLAAGLPEDCVLQVTAELTSAVADLASGQAHGSVAFRAAGVELLLDRRADRVRLSLVRLQRPSRVVLRGVEVELAALRAAALDCGRTLLRELRTINPALARSAPVRQLAAATQRLYGGPSAPAGRKDAPTLPASDDPPSAWRAQGSRSHGCEIEFRDPDRLLESFRGRRPDLQSLLVRGRFSLRIGPAATTWSSEGYLFLMLRELSLAAQGLVRALEAGETEHTLQLCDGAQLPVDLRHGRALPPGERRPVACDGAALAAALFSAARAFARLAQRRNPRQRSNGYLSELRLGADEGLARCDDLLAAPYPPRARAAPRIRVQRPAPPEPPFVAGRLRRLAYRGLWTAPFGGVTGLCLSGSLLLALGDEGATALSIVDGAAAWSNTRGVGAALAMPGGEILAGAGREALRLGPTGEPLWSSSLLGPDSQASALALSSDGRCALLASATEAAAFSTRDGKPLWRFSPPGCSGLRLLATEALFVIATSDGRLYGIDLGGKLCWRARTGARVIAGPLAWGHRAILIGQQPEGARLHQLALESGRILPAASPELTRAGGACPCGDGLAVAGTVGDEGAVVGFAPDGRIAWRWPADRKGAGATPGLGPGVPQLAPLPGGELAVRGSGAIACLAGDGTPRWEQPFAEEVPGGPAPILRRGVLLASGERGILALDPATGQRLGRAGGDRPLLPSHFEVDDRLTIYCADDEGPIEAFALGTFLSIC